MNGINKKLIKDAQYGNEVALKKLLKEISKYAFYRTYKEIGIKEDAEESVQSILNRVSQTLHKFDFSDKHFMNWINKIIDHEIFNKIRTNVRFEAVVAINDEYTIDYPDYKTSTPERLTMLEHLKMHIGEEDYILLYDRIGHQLKFEVLAEMYNCSLSTIKRKYVLALNKAKEYVGEENDKKGTKKVNKK